MLSLHTMHAACIIKGEGAAKRVSSKILKRISQTSQTY